MAEKGVNVDTVARQLALERSRLNTFIAGTAIPNENTSKRLAKYFGEDPQEWIDNVDKRDDGKVTISSLPTDFIKVAKTSEIAEEDMKIVFHDLVVIANAEGNFYAFGNVCPHAAGPIGEGFLEGCIVECPWHAGRWDVRTGKALTLLATADIPMFDLRIVGDDIEIKVSEAALKQGVVSAAGPDPA
ncbi:Rieske 2Fe-2S domain-containing protein [Phenylobacterium sp.]|uniref:Rieske 2Fe-2S domain-containing protein n=1 Tax=Phenylobacterium sp. TaxID=1871053 RepID=UPI0027361073|nr:Rieske 2Fe-2S domain-containing protein [Phenylobacterium sp.]MDP3659830.1 Rieske 2Fe-2S domain-containing protein [Phenylobacterium sp.]